MLTGEGGGERGGVEVEVVVVVAVAVVVVVVVVEEVFVCYVIFA